MAVAHFGLQYEWKSARLDGIPAQLGWALFALNFSWAAMLLAVGALMLHAATLNPDTPFVRKTVLVVGLFWVAHGAYVWAVPMPLPRELLWMRTPMAVFPLAIITLQWGALLTTKQQMEAREPI
jgi:hypothetical protein